MIGGFARRGRKEQAVKKERMRGKDGGKRLISALVEMLYPPQCLLCRDPVARGAFRLCGECFAKYEAEREVLCPWCGGTVQVCRCGEELLLEEGIASFEEGERKVLAARFYDPQGNLAPLTRRLILRNKQEYDEGLSRILSWELAVRLTKWAKERGGNFSGWVVTYPPRSPEHLLRFGFDHGELLALQLAAFMGLTMEKTMVRHEGTEQKALSAKERMENAEKGLLPRRKEIREGGRYLLVDDIFTTGATMTAAREILLSCGALEVFPVAVAKTLASRRPSCHSFPPREGV